LLGYAGGADSASPSNQLTSKTQYTK